MKSAAVTLTFLLIGCAASAQAQEHIVPLPTVRQDLSHAASQRASDIADIERLLARPEAQQELSKVRISPAQAQKAVSLMSDEELARLAARARTADQDVQGGFLKTILAIIGAITVIVILVAVLA